VQGVVRERLCPSTSLSLAPACCSSSLLPAARPSFPFSTFPRPAAHQASFDINVCYHSMTRSAARQIIARGRWWPRLAYGLGLLRIKLVARPAAHSDRDYTIKTNQYTSIYLHSQELLLLLCHVLSPEAPGRREAARESGGNENVYHFPTPRTLGFAIFI